MEVVDVRIMVFIIKMRLEVVQDNALIIVTIVRMELRVSHVSLPENLRMESVSANHHEFLLEAIVNVLLL